MEVPREGWAPALSETAGPAPRLTRTTYVGAQNDFGNYLITGPMPDARTEPAMIEIAEEGADF